MYCLKLSFKKGPKRLRLGFKTLVIKWLETYLLKVWYWGTPIFNIYSHNGLPQPLSESLFYLYPDDKCVFYQEKGIKQYHTVDYFRCHLDSNVSDKSMAMKVLKKVSAKLKFFYSKKKKYVIWRLKRLLCNNALIQPYFNNGYTFWFPLLNENLQQKPEAAQNKYMSLLLDIPFCSQKGAIHLRKINWFPVSETIETCFFPVSAFTQ